MIKNSGTVDRLTRCATCKFCVTASEFPELRIFATIGDVPIFDFRGYFGGKLTGVKNRSESYARFAFAQRRPNRLDIVAQRVDNSDTCDNYSALVI